MNLSSKTSALHSKLSLTLTVCIVLLCYCSLSHCQSVYYYSLSIGPQALRGWLCESVSNRQGMHQS